LNTTAAIWLEAARPKTLWAAISPVILGIAIAASYDVLHIPSALLALTGAILIQIGTNFHNDVADFEKGADREDRLGPRRLVAAGLISRRAMRLATVAVFMLAIASGVYLMIRGGLPIVIIGFSSILFGLAYTGGRYSLAYLGIADLFVLVFFGPIAVAGTFYVQALYWPSTAWLAGLSPGLLCVCILLVNNIRDVEQDIESGKKTLIVRFGRSFGEALYLVFVIVGCVLPVFLWEARLAPVWVLLSILALPLCLQSWKRLRSIPVEDGAKLNPVLGETARNLLIHSLLFSLGWIIGW